MALADRGRPPLVQSPSHGMNCLGHLALHPDLLPLQNGLAEKQQPQLQKLRTEKSQNHPETQQTILSDDDRLLRSVAWLWKSWLCVGFTACVWDGTRVPWSAGGLLPLFGDARTSSGPKEVTTRLQKCHICGCTPQKVLRGALEITIRQAARNVAFDTAWYLT